LNELQNKIKNLKILAKQFKDDKLIKLDIARFEKMLKDLMFENNILSELNQFKEV